MTDGRGRSPSSWGALYNPREKARMMAHAYYACLNKSAVFRAELLALAKQVAPTTAYLQAGTTRPVTRILDPRLPQVPLGNSTEEQAVALDGSVVANRIWESLKQEVLRPVDDAPSFAARADVLAFIQRWHLPQEDGAFDLLFTMARFELGQEPRLRLRSGPRSWISQPSQPIGVVQDFPYDWERAATDDSYPPPPHIGQFAGVATGDTSRRFPLLYHPPAEPERWGDKLHTTDDAHLGERQSGSEENDYDIRLSLGYQHIPLRYRESKELHRQARRLYRAAVEQLTNEQIAEIEDCDVGSIKQSIKQWTTALKVSTGRPRGRRSHRNNPQSPSDS